MRIAFLSIPKQVDKDLSVDSAYRQSGNNLGNMVFVNAISDQLKYESSVFSYSLDASTVNNDFDAVVIPAANWLNPGIDLGGFYEIIKNIKIPCIVIGIGAQSDDYNNIPKLPDGTIKFLDHVSANSVSIGTRGLFSEKVLHHYGYTSAKAIGCPSVYWNCSRVAPKVDKKSSFSHDKFVIQGTRHNIPNNSFYTKGVAKTQREILLKARRENIPYIIQSEYEELFYVNSSISDDTSLEKITARLEGYYNEKLEDGLSEYLRDKMLYFYDVSSWKKKLSDFDFLLTSRIHGAIMALHAGLPAMLICHDTRTLEIAEFCGIPHVHLEEYRQNDNLDFLFSSVSYEKLLALYFDNFIRYRDFLNENSLDNFLS